MISSRFGVFMERWDVKGAWGAAGSEQGAAAHSESLSVDLGLFVLVFGGMKDAGGGRKGVKGQRGGRVLVLVLPGPVWCRGVTWCPLDAEQELYGMRPERRPRNWSGFLEKRELGVHPIPFYSLQLSLGQEEPQNAGGVEGWIGAIGQGQLCSPATWGASKWLWQPRWDLCLLPSQNQGLLGWLKYVLSV